MKTKLILLGLFALSSFAVTFVSQPTLTKDSNNKWWVEFQVSESTDVAISIIDLRDSTVVRHLAAGKLGSKAPSPLTSNSLYQKIEWDRKDDLGYTMANPELMKVRVRAGMSVNFRNFIGFNPYSFSKGTTGTGGGVYGIVQGVDGSVYICGEPGGIYQAHWMSAYKNVRQNDISSKFLFRRMLS
ncbi:MAG: hypothetical protein JNL74_14025 [Fibrobacteres bacterium]|nr:hypothetical protein [Fibrobacterota bacterium]